MIKTDPYPMVQLRRLARQASISSSPIKNTVQSEKANGLYPGYSASGQDVWLTPDQATFNGDGIVISAVGARCGKAFLATGRWGVTANTAVLLPREHVSAQFLWYILNNESFWIKGQTAQPYVQLGPSLALPIPSPSLQQQVQIAEFLDRETAKIDALIDKQEQLIATLREDRAATIVHAVTNGLNVTVERRDSHVAWIGSIPAHWEIFKGTWIGTPFGSPAVPEEDVSTTGDRAFLKVSSLSASGFSPKDPEWFVSSTYRAGSDFVAFPKRGAAIFTNKVNVVDFPAVIDPNLMGWKMLPGHDAYYYAFIIGSLRLEEIADVSSVPQLNAKHIAGLRLPRPPVHEQREIVSYLLEKCKKIDSLIKKSNQMIEELGEYRSALITNAVTGKIDVGEAV